MPVQADDLLSTYRLAKAHDPILQGAKEALLAAKEATPQAQALFLPTVNATANYTNNRLKAGGGGLGFDNTTGELQVQPPGTIHFGQNTYSLQLSQPVFYFEQWIHYAKATELVKKANATYAAAEQELIIRVVNRYFGVLKAIDALNFARAERSSFSKFYEQSEQRFKAGLIAITDVQIAKAQHDNAYSNEIAAENELQNAKEQLREITGSPIEAFSFLRENLILKSPEPENLEQWVLTALEQNFMLQASRFQIAVSRADIRINQAGYLPTLNINGAVNHSNSTSLETNNTLSNVGLQISIPIFSGGATRSKTKQAVHLYEQSQKQLETLHRQVESNTRQAFRGVLTQISQAAALKQAIVSNESALEATSASFKVGTRTIVDVLNSQSSLIQAKKNYANARYDYIVKSMQLKQAAGTLSPEDIQHINAWLIDEQPKAQVDLLQNGG